MELMQFYYLQQSNGQPERALFYYTLSPEAQVLHQSKFFIIDLAT